MENIRYEVDGDGIALLTWDMPGRSMNVLSDASMSEFAELVTRIAEDEAVKGAVITSGKPAFIAGADLSMMEGQASGAGMAGRSEEERIRALYDNFGRFQALLRRMETCGKPFAAAINGTALGGGLEVCLACHYRVAADDPKIQLGLPEAKVGLLPGGGGTQRLPRLIGIAQALPLMLRGTSLDPQEAKALGVIHAVVKAKDVVKAARKWVKDNAGAKQPWDRPGYQIPGGGPYTPSTGMVFQTGNALLRKETYGNYPAQLYIMRCVYEGTLVPIDRGLKVETRYFTKLLLDPRSRNMVRSLFLSMQELSKGARRPKDVPAKEIKKLGVLGAGMMGAGIAHVSALAGIEVVLIDRDQETAEKGKAHSAALLKAQVERGRLAENRMDKILRRITATTDYDDLKGADLVIEAVFEDRTVKAEVTKRAEAVLGKKAVMASNTSTLPITGLAEASARPERFIGIHFFSPVEKMQLVEIILGKQTGEEALARAIDYVRQIRKVPIVVNDSRGFYTSRVFATYIQEGLEMLAEGVKPALIENAGRMAGMPVGPLAVNDEVSLDLSYHIRKQTKADLGDQYQETAADRITALMVEKHGRLGRKARKGFYDYPEKGRKRLWPGLSEVAPVAERQPDVEELKTRFLYRQAVETARCMEENVLTDVRDADVGAILGWGFAPYTGGPLSLIDMVGAGAFVAECERMAAQYGPRFAPPQLLRDMAARGESFYRGSQPAKRAA